MFVQQEMHSQIVLCDIKTASYPRTSYPLQATHCFIIPHTSCFNFSKRMSIDAELTALVWQCRQQCRRAILRKDWMYELRGVKDV